MKYFADLHIHSRFARACSQNISLQTLSRGAKLKGLDVLGTGDFSHPVWLKELKQQLTKVSDGVFAFDKTNFLLTTEVANVYEQGSKSRKVHQIVIAPDFEVVEQINSYLEKFSDLSADGRPVLRLSCPEFVEALKSISKDIEVIPSHAWTPWFGVFGSKSGFDSLKDCYQDSMKHIHAIETGLSSDPPMNWRLSQLDKVQILSFSDAHSAQTWRLGREATIFDTGLSYGKLINAIRTGEGLAGTIEVDPSYGKYHYDGHRNCEVWMEPGQSKKYNNRCPRCGGKLTIGVLNRVEQLADRQPGHTPHSRPPYYELLPLSELLAAVLGTTPYTKKVAILYSELLQKFGSEYDVLLKVKPEDLYGATKERVADAILKNRAGDLVVRPGYDGVYGKLLLDKAAEKPKIGQRSLAEFG